jgi:hypothetical protein
MPATITEFDLEIVASTKVGALLDRYPDLEDLLISIAPPFKKLRNPLLRRSVAKVASLEQAAVVANIPATDLVNLLRREVGQEPLPRTDAPGRSSYFQSKPDWFDTTRIAASIDERDQRDQVRMPFVNLFESANRIPRGEIVELITTSLPAPGIDIMKNRGFRVWSVEEQPDLIRSYFQRK